MQTIDLYDDDDYFVQVVLDGVLFYMTMSWNTEALFWTMAFEDFNHNLLVSGVKVVPNYPLISRYFVKGMPAGELVVISDSVTVAKDDFVAGYATMVYVSSAEL
jgi:hypothetical protein